MTFALVAIVFKMLAVRIPRATKKITPQIMKVPKSNPICPPEPPMEGMNLLNASKNKMTKETFPIILLSQ